MLDWASHLKHLQSIFLEFDADEAPGEPTMIKYFREGLKPSIRAEIEQYGRELDSFEDTIQKAVNAEAQATLSPRSATRETDQHCPQSTWPAISTAAKSQGSPMKDPRVEEPKTRTQKANSSYCPESTETSDKKTRKEKKKRHRRDQAWRCSVSTSITSINSSSLFDGVRRELSQVTYYNCHKKGNYAKNYSEPQKNSL